MLTSTPGFQVDAKMLGGMAGRRTVHGLPSPRYSSAESVSILVVFGDLSYSLLVPSFSLASLCCFLWLFGSFLWLLLFSLDFLSIFRSSWGCNVALGGG